MNKEEKTFLQMLAAVRIVCNDFSSVWSSTVSFKDAFTAGVTDTEAALPGILAQQGAKTKGTTTTKGEARAALSAQMQFIASRIRLYAVTAGNEALQRDAKLSPSTVEAAKEDSLVGMATRVAGLATAHIVALGAFGVTAADVSAMSAAAATYAGMIGGPARVRKTAAEATSALKALVSAARVQLSVMDAHLVLWRETAPEFCSMYGLSRRIGKPAFRMRALEVSVHDRAGTAIVGAAFLLPSAKVKRKTSGKGACRVSHLPEGAYTAQVSAPGYAGREVAFFINKGKMTKLAVVLEGPQL